MAYKKYVVHLTQKDRDNLRRSVSVGKHSAREFTHAWIPLLADKGMTDKEIHEFLDVSTRTIERIRLKHITGGLDLSISDLPRPGQPNKLSSDQEAHIIAIACSNPPIGRNHWTIELLREEAIHRGIVDTISKEPIRILLKNHDLKPWQKKLGAFQS